MHGVTEEVEVVDRAVVVDRNRVRPGRKRASVEVVAVRVPQVDREVLVHVAGERVREHLQATRRRWVPLLDLVHGPVEVGHVHVAAPVLAERGDVLHREKIGLDSVIGRIRDLQGLRMDHPVAEVRVDVAPVQVDEIGIADDVPARDRAPSARVWVLEDGFDQRRRRRVAELLARVVVVSPLAAAPAEVRRRSRRPARAAGSRSPRRVLADVGEREVAGLAVEGEAPRVAHAEG